KARATAPGTFCGRSTSAASSSSPTCTSATGSARARRWPTRRTSGRSSGWWPDSGSPSPDSRFPETEMFNPYPFARPLLFALDPERAHELTLGALDGAACAGLLRLAAGTPVDDPVEVMGLR